MISDRKFLWLIWFTRICLLFGISGNLFAGYVSSFVHTDMMLSYAGITVALFLGMLFFSTFPEYRLQIRFNLLKKRLSERTDFDHNLSSEASSKNEVIRYKKYMTVVIFLTVFMIFNFLLAFKAYSNNNHPRVFLHIVFIIAASFTFNACLLIFSVDETFKKLDGLVSQLKKDKTTKEKSE